MTINLTLVLAMGALYTCGVYLMLDTNLTRVLLGLMLLMNGTNILLLSTGGFAGHAPIFNFWVPIEHYNDSLPQAFILTSIVISLALTAYILSLIDRIGVLEREDDIEYDQEDQRIAHRLEKPSRKRFRAIIHNLKTGTGHDLSEGKEPQ